MGDFTPWAVCVGVFLIYPALTFVLGFYVGKNGLPFEVRRRAGWGRRKPIVDDGYGVTTDIA